MESVLIPCVKWTKKGYAAPHGKQIKIDPDQLKQVLKGTQPPAGSGLGSYQRDAIPLPFSPCPCPSSSPSP